MTTSKTLSLIDGSFSTTEAEEILLNIYNTKIQFHEQKNFSAMERFGKNDETAQRRIPELKAELAKLVTLLSEAKKTNQSLQIKSEIQIASLAWAPIDSVDITIANN